MREQAKRAQKADSAAKRAILAGACQTAYHCIVADPPWAPRDKLPGPTRGAARQYPVMSTADICALGGRGTVYGEPVADDAILFLWRLASMQGDALAVAAAWGFRVVSEVVWRKITKRGRAWFGMGRTVRASHETALICVRGRASRIVCGRNVRSVFEAPVPLNDDGRYVHSAKPEAFFTNVVEPLVGSAAAVPCLEIFARRRRPGWAAIGNQLPEEES